MDFDGRATAAWAASDRPGARRAGAGLGRRRGFGLIHADSVPNLVDGAAVRLIDFDDCGFVGFYDLAAALSFRKTIRGAGAAIGMAGRVPECAAADRRPGRGG